MICGPTTTVLRFVCLVYVLIASQTASHAEESSSFIGSTMGTRYEVQVGTSGDLTEIKKKVDQRLLEINKMMSTYDPESELSRFNQYREASPFKVSSELAKVVQFALRVADDSGGAYDPTVGPAVNLWGFGPAGRRTEPPRDDKVNEVMKRIGYQYLSEQTDPPALIKQIPDVYLDLSSTAKGFAVDEISKLLTAEGYKDSLVVIGGEIFARGRKPDGTQWRIGIEEPDSEGKPVSRAVFLENTSASTSGDWRNSYVHDGVRYSHVIDPQTARPVRHRLASVTVFADTSMQADAWSTTLLVMGDDAGIAWCEQRGIAAMFFDRKPDGEVLARSTTHVAKRVTPSGP